MKKAKHFIVLLAALFSISRLQAQKDSVHALFKPPKLNIHYSYLQWEFGYTGFIFNNNYLNGSNFDLFGMVFNDDVELSIGFDQCSSTSINSYQFDSAVQAYSDFYFKIEPMLFPDKIVNFAMPIKFMASVLSYPSLSTSGNYRRRPRSYGFFAITPGIEAFINIFPAISFGAGINYRFRLSNSSHGIPYADYNNFSISTSLRVKIFTRANGRKKAALHKSYFNPSDRFQ